VRNCRSTLIVGPPRTLPICKCLHIRSFYFVMRWSSILAYQMSDQATRSNQAITNQSGTSQSTSPPTSASFDLYDLRVEVVIPHPDAKIYCGAKSGDHFELHGELLFLPPGQGFSIYSLSSVLPLLAAKQRETHKNDWMTSDAEVACPDPNCETRLRITRVGRRTFKRSETTGTETPTSQE
jgi:uncharacterized repeat protein (TIGR04076 family)